MPDPERQDRTVVVERRAPFSDNPTVGARGLRTQQRILDAALRAFGDEGYHGCSIDRITKLARCSRVSFYQYFANKEDVFRQLAGQVARQVSASTEALDPLTPDLDGWVALRAWLSRYAEIHARYEPVFHAVETDDALAVVARRTGEESVTRIHVRLEATTLPTRSVDPVIRLLLECANHTLDVGGLLRRVAPGDYTPERIEVSITDVLHRALFGRLDGVNVHAPAQRPAPPIRPTPDTPGGIRPGELNGASNHALDALLAAGRDVFVERGYHNTRVEDLAAAAGVSHGAFYRYFANKSDLARVLTADAAQAVGATVLVFPETTEAEPAARKAALRRWLYRYNEVHVQEAAMLRVWIDAALADPALRFESAPLLDWGRRRLARALEPRGFGDADIDAVILVGLLGVFGARRRPAAEIDAAVHVVERGFLGR